MLVNNAHELKIVGVVDLEWSYAAPRPARNRAPVAPPRTARLVGL